MSQTSHSGFAVVRSALVAGAVASGALLLSGAGPADARSDGGLSVADISVVVGSGAHTETITVGSDSPAIGAPNSLLIYSFSPSVFFSAPVPSSSTNATCAKGTTDAIYKNLSSVWTCTAPDAGWGAGEIQLGVDITESAVEATDNACLNGGCVLQVFADWDAPIGGSSGSITVVPGLGMGTFASPSASATEKSSSAAGTSTRTSPSSAPTTATATPAASSSSSAAAASASESASASPSSSGSPPASASAASGTRSAPLDAAPTGGSAESRLSQLWALLAVLCIITAGVTSAILTGKGRHRA